MGSKKYIAVSPGGTTTAIVSSRRALERLLKSVTGMVFTIYELIPVQTAKPGQFKRPARGARKGKQ